MKQWRFIALAALIALSACGGGSNSSGNSGQANTLVVARVKDAVTLDPAIATDGLSLNLTQEVLWGLVRFVPGTFKIQPALASAWSMSPDGKTWTFTLRKDLKFSDGTPINAQAVVFNFNRWRLLSDPNHGNDVFGYYATQFGGFPGLITNVAAQGSDKVVFTLAHPQAPFLHNLAMPSFAIGSPAALRKDRAGFALHPVGYGPYMVSDWVKDDHITLQANPNFHDVTPYYKTIIVRDIPDQATSVLEISQGNVDILTDPRPDDAKQLAQKSGLTVYQQPSNNLSYLAMNTEKAPFDKVAVRRAIAYAVNVPQIISAFYTKGAVVADNWTPPGMLGADPSVKHYAYDPTKAKALLASAGLRSFPTQLYFTTAPRPYTPEPQRIAEAIQANLKNVGINVTLVPLEWAVFLDKIRNGEHPMCLTGWSGDNGDPDNFMYSLLDKDGANAKPNGQNYSFWRDENFHKLMMAGQTAATDAQRQAIYAQANAMIADQVPALAIVHTTVPIVMKSTIKGYVPKPDTAINFEFLHL